MRKYFRTIIVLVCILILGVCMWSVKDTVKKEKVKVACIGDSITFRFGYEDVPENNYPVVLAQILGSKYEVTNFGVPGACVQRDGDFAYMNFDTCQSAVEYEADVLVFMMGTNDAKSNNWENQKKFYQAYTMLLDIFLQSKHLPEIYICTSPEVFYVDNEAEGIEDYGIKPEVVAEITAIQRQIAEEKGYTLIDIHDISKEKFEWFKEDGIHPTKEGAKGLAEAVAKAINQ